jgi:NhaA family Na+:H+ antiporter
MSIFITLLAFDNPKIISNSKISIIAASIISGLIGFLFLQKLFKERITDDENPLVTPEEKL